MKSRSSKAEWSPGQGRLDHNGDPVPPDRRRPFLIVASIIGLWLILGIISTVLQKTDIDVPALTIPVSDVTTIEVANDMDTSVFFVVCGDRHCQDIPKGTRPGDYNLVTPSHSQKMRVIWQDGKPAVFGVMTEGDTQLQGCLRFSPGPEDEKERKVTLSNEMQQCDQPAFSESGPSYF